MRTVLWASVRMYARRYVATVSSVVVGVGFIVATSLLTSATGSGLLADAQAQYRGAGAVVSDVAGVRQADDVLHRARGGAVVNAATTQALAVGHRQVTDQGQVGTVSAAPSLRWQHLTAGAAPTGAGEALVDAQAARENHVRPGDHVRVGTGVRAVTVTVTGLAASSSGPLQAPVYLTWPDLSRFGDEVLVHDVAARTTDTSALRRLLPHSVTVQPRAAYLQQLQKDIARGIDVIGLLVLVFAAVAFFVAALVIANTFAILLAQRSRDFALLRCVGATRRQLRRSVLRESLVIGVAASTLGVVGGLVLGWLVVQVGRVLLPRLPLGSATVSAWWVAGAWLLGVLVTMGGSLLPALHGTRVGPLAALRPDGAVDVRSRAGRVRIGVAVMLELAGVASLAVAVRGHSAVPMLLGGMLSFLGVLALGPVLVPACIRALGAVTGWLGLPVRLATSNALRNPRRTASTTTSLLVGVTLVSALVVGISSVRVSVSRAMDQDNPLDVGFVAARAVPSDAVDRVRRLSGVRAAHGLRGLDVRMSQGAYRVPQLLTLAVDRSDGALLRGHGPGSRPRAGTVYLAWSTIAHADLDPDRPVRLVSGERSVTLRVRGTSGLGDVALVAPTTLSRVSDRQPVLRAVWARAGGTADADRLHSAVSAIGWGSGGTVVGGLQQRAYVNEQLDVLTGSVLALVGIAVLIAVVGIGSTVGLSVLERRREHAVLRALGLARGQLRGTLAAESVLMAVVAGLLGVVIGTAYALVGLAVVATDAVSVTVQVPGVQLLVITLVSAAAGLLACVLPARRATRLAPAALLTAE